MAETVNVPGVGKTKKTTAYIAVAAVGGLIVIYYVRRKSSSSAAAAPAATTTSQYPPDGTTGNPSDPYSTDPATGQTYGDEAAGSGLLGAFGSGAASGMYYDPATGAYDLTSPYGTTTGTSPYQTQGGPPFANNSAWSDWVIQELGAQNPNLDVGALTDALGLYLAGQPVSAAQKTLIFDATAIGGDPPVAGTAGYPPNVKTNGSPGPGTSATVTVPNLVGERVENADSALQALGLKSAFGTRKPGVPYTVSAQSPAAGRRVTEGSTVTLTIKAGAAAPPPKKPPPKAGTVTVPVTYGEPAETALSKIQAAGLTASTSPARNPADQYASTGSTPQGGSKVARGSHVTVGVKITRKG